MQLSLLKTQAYVNGCFIDALNKHTFAVSNPANHQEICQVAELGAQETQIAIEHAAVAQKKWQALLPKERSQLLRRWYDLVLENQEQLAHILSLEQGKPIAESRGEILYGASFIEWFAEEAKRIYGDVLPACKDSQKLMMIKQAVGVVAAITPWNFPHAMITRKAAPALAAGCAIILKPAPETPLSALALAQLAHQAGIPAGVFNVIPTSVALSPEVGAVLTESTTVRKLTFTGSTKVGKILMAQCANTVKRLSLELGGNAPSLVFDDANLDNAVQNIIASKFRNSGQTCICTNRIYVQASVYEKFIQKFSLAMQQLKLGSAFEQGINIGPLINFNAVEKIEEHIQDAMQKGANLVLGGKRSSLGGSFFEPTLLTDVTQQMRVAKEETFAPLAPIFKFEQEADAIQMANDTDYGLASYIYTQDVSRIWRVAEQLEYGMVGINEGLITNEVAPFGGVKQSGLGREGSKYGIEEYLEMKYLCTKTF